MPVVFMEYPDDDTLGKLTMVYDVYEHRIQDGSDWSQSTDDFTFFVSYNSMKSVLKTSYYFGCPLAADAESWEYNETVSIGIYSATVLGTIDAYGHDSWMCGIDNQTVLFYDMDSGFLIYYNWSSQEDWRISTLVEMNIELPGPYVKDAGVLLTGIFVELAVIVWLFGQQLEKSR